jgi:hypothetical protein
LLIVIVVGWFGVPAASGAFGGPGPADTNPPTGTVIFPLPGAWTYFNYITLSVRFTDPDGISVPSLSMALDGVSLSPSWTGFVLFASASGVSDGPHTAEARASDQLGNGPTIVRWSFSVDTIRPVVNITSPSGNPELASGFVNVAWTGSDSGSGIDSYWIRLDNGPPIGVRTATTFPFRDLSPGVHYFEVGAYDKAGNSAEGITMATVPPRASPTNTTTQITVVMPDGIPSWAIVLVVINAVEASAIAWLVVRRRREPPVGPPPP